jgi:hypothetical protein
VSNCDNPTDPYEVKPIHVNRVSVLGLWTAVVAERLGHCADTALTLERAVAGIRCTGESAPDKQRKQSGMPTRRRCAS